MKSERRGRSTVRQDAVTRSYLELSGPFGVSLPNSFNRKGRSTIVLGWAIAFLIAALIAALFGFGGIATAFAGIAQLLFYVFVVIFAAVLIMHLLGRGTARPPMP